MERREAEVEQMSMSDSVSSFTLSAVRVSRENVNMKDSQLFRACCNTHANIFRARPGDSYCWPKKVAYMF